MSLLHPFIILLFFVLFDRFWWWATGYSDTSCIPGPGRPFRRKPLHFRIPPPNCQMSSICPDYVQISFWVPLWIELELHQTPRRYSQTLLIEQFFPPGSSAQDILKQLPSVNPRCDMHLIGDPLLNIQAGWMVPGQLENREEVWSIWKGGKYMIPEGRHEIALQYVSVHISF